MDDQTFDTDAAARYLGCSPSAMRLWRSQGRGAKYFRAELEKWIEKQSREPWQRGKDDKEDQEQQR